MVSSLQFFRHSTAEWKQKTKPQTTSSTGEFSWGHWEINLQETLRDCSYESVSKTLFVPCIEFTLTSVVNQWPSPFRREISLYYTSIHSSWLPQHFRGSTCKATAWTAVSHTPEGAQIQLFMHLQITWLLVSQASEGLSPLPDSMHFLKHN